MTKQVSFTVYLIFFISVLPIYAGTWIDDFNDGNLESWTPRNIVGTGEWTVQDGKLSGWNKGGTSVIWMVPAEWKDYTLEASVCLIEKLGAGDMEMSLAMRADPSTMSIYGFGLQFAGGKYPTDQIQINRIRNFVNVDHWTRQNYEISNNTWYKLKGSIIGNHLSFYINNELLSEFEAIAPMLLSGTVGLYVCDVHILVDDIIIKGDDIPDGGPFQVTDVKLQDKLTTTWVGIKSRI